MAFNSAVKSYGSYQAASEATADFNRTRHLITENCGKISRNNAQLRRIVGTSSDNMEDKDKVHKLQHQTNQLARQTTTLLQTLSSIVLSPIEMKHNRAVVEGLTTDFSNLMRDLQSMQRSLVSESKKNLNREKNLKQQQQQQQLISTGEEEEEELNSSQIFHGEAGVQSVMTSEKDLHFIQEQERQIKQLETDISDINEVFKDLGVLIHNQSSVVDSIEANTESAASEVSRGTEELRKARVYREKIRKRKMMLIVVATVVGALLLMTIIISASKS